MIQRVWLASGKPGLRVETADTYGYALSGRLDTVRRGGALVSDYGFDDNGNRTSHRIGPASPLRGQSWPCLGALPAGGDSTVSGSYDAQDRMTAYGTCTYDYTRNGELTRRVDSATNSTTTVQCERGASDSFVFQVYKVSDL